MVARLTTAQIVDQLPGLTPEQLAAVEDFEQAHAARVTVLNKIQSLRAPTTDTPGTV